MIVAGVRRILSGRVTFTVTGGFPGLFLESCAAAGIELENVTPAEDGLRASATEASFRLVPSAAEKAGMALRVERRTGLPQLLRRYRARWGIPAGLLLGALLLWHLSGCLWEICVTGNEYVSREEILDALEELDVAVGTPLRRINGRTAAEKLQMLLPRLSWAAVNVVGCKALVEIREVRESETPPESAYCNVVAARDGVIVRADVLAGVGQPKIGEAVVKGDLLVSGVVEMNNGFTRLTAAKAVVTALTKTELSAHIPGTLTAERIVTRTAAPRLLFFGLSLPLRPLPDGAERESAAAYLQSRRTVFPIGTEQTTAVIFTEEPRTLAPEEAAPLCFADFAERAFDRYKDAQVLSLRLRLTPSAGGCDIAAEFTCVEDIARRVPIVVSTDENCP